MALDARIHVNVSFLKREVCCYLAIVTQSICEGNEIIRKAPLHNALYFLVKNALQPNSLKVSRTCIFVLQEAYIQALTPQQYVRETS